MDVSELRKRILHALDDARREASTRRDNLDAARETWMTFLEDVAVPVVRKAAEVLRAEGERFSVNTPAGSVRLVAERSAETYLELVLDPGGREAQALGRVSLVKGREGQVLEERPVAHGKPVAELSEDDVSQFLIAEIPKLVVRR